MSLRHCRYSGFSTLRKLARHQIMNNCPIFSSIVSLCKVFSAHLSARDAFAAEAGAGLPLSLSLAAAGRAKESAKTKTRRKEAGIRDIAENDSRIAGEDNHAREWRCYGCGFLTVNFVRIDVFTMQPNPAPRSESPPHPQIRV